MNPRPPGLEPETLHRCGEGRRYENGYRYLATRFSEMEDELARLTRKVEELRGVIKEISVERELIGG